MADDESMGCPVDGKRGQRPPPPKNAKATFVYFVQATTLRLIKIGIANDLYSRMKGLQTSSPDRLVLLGAMIPAMTSAAAMEQRLHIRFAELREHGEWFRPEPRLLSYIGRYAQSEAALQERLAGEAMAKLEASVRPEIPAGVPAPQGNGRAAIMARYRLARGLEV